MMTSTMQHRVTYKGTYFTSGSRGTAPYTVETNVPEDAVKNQNLIGWFKEQMRNPKSPTYKQILKDHPDFDRLCTHIVQDLNEVEEIPD
jgi:hypothetical protein